MKNLIFQKLRKALVVITGLMMLTLVNCTREEGDLVPATFPAVGEIFIDTFSGGLDYAAFGESKKTAFDVDTEVKYSGTASMRFEVPDATDPEGSFAGGIIATSGGRDGLDLIIAGGRDLSSFNVLSFWAKSSIPASIGQVGFGTDFLTNTYTASQSNVPINSNWKKYYVPIPNPAILTQEKGMFLFAAGAVDSRGYTVWVDEVKFEYLEGLAQGRAVIQNGLDVSVTAYNEQTIAPITTVVYNLPNGQDVTVDAANAYFDFISTDPNVVSVADGVLTVVGAGESEVTVSIQGLTSLGSLTVTSKGTFPAAPVPTRDAANVLSIFSDAYTNIPTTFFNGYWEPYQTTESADFQINGDHVLNYTNFNFVGNQFPAVNGSAMTHLHMDIFIPDVLPGGASLKITVKDFGANSADGGGDDSLSPSFTITTFSNPKLQQGTWASVNIPISAMASRTHLGQIIYENGGTPPSGFWLDNIYFYNANP